MDRGSTICTGRIKEVFKIFNRRSVGDQKLRTSSILLDMSRYYTVTNIKVEKEGEKREGEKEERK